MAFFQRSVVSSQSGSTKSRRPRGVSRRQRKRQLQFETLEDRRVMSADSPLAALHGEVSDDNQVQVQSFSSNTLEGQQQILLNELYWQSLSEGASLSNIAQLSIPTDPLSADQWFLINTGQEVGNPDFQAIFGKAGEDINVAPVWNQGLTGAGVTVAVVDSTLQIDHPDLAANVSSTLGFNVFTGATGPASGFSSPHGTSVAGLIGAVADNGLGGSGVAPGVTLVPITFLNFNGSGSADPNAAVNAFRYETNQIDITNNSWGPAIDLNGDGINERGIASLSVAETEALRDSVIFGRKASPNDPTGLGVIHVFASGNDAASPFDPGFQSQGGLNNSGYNGWVNSRYTIGVTGVDHDGFYNNADGTVTAFAETSASVLVAAPTGSNGEAPLSIGDDAGTGSGVVTTDLTGEAGFNFSPDPVTGQEFDRDFLPDTDFTSRFGGTSSAAPLVSGVIALMLEANPNLGWRDVQEILVRSARQNAEFEIPTASGVQFPTQNTWIVNQMPVFQDPDLWNPLINPFVQTFTPTLDPTLSGFGPGDNVGPGPNANFVGGLFDAEKGIFVLNGAGHTGIHSAPTPQVLTNGAGFTVSQGRGVYGEQIGYAHGVVDAELAVQLAQQWGTKNQELPNELSFTSAVNLGGGNSINIPAMEVSSAAAGSQRIPGGLGGQTGFSAFWDEYFSLTPFANNPTFSNRGGYVELEVPPDNTMTIETVEVKISLTPGTDTQFLDNMRVLLVSPSGTYQELNQFFVATNASLAQQDSLVQANGNTTTFRQTGALQTVDTDPNNPLVVTLTSNRSWGERSDSQIIIDPTTGEPADVAGLLKQGWQLYFENYGNAAVGVSGLEVVWHGSPIGANTQRVQGLIGVDDNRDDAFNFSRVIQNNTDIDGTLRLGEVTNTIDLAHESMASNITVVARRASDGVVVDQFVVGADGNYYFDLIPDDYIISIDDPLGRTALEDLITPNSLLQNYKSEWTISADFFKVWDYDANLDIPVQVDGTPFAFLDGGGSEVAGGVKNLNFLLDPGPATTPEVDFSGVVFADINGDGIFNNGDVNVPGISVFGDVNRNGQFDAGEVIVATNSNGEYSLTVPLNSSLNSTVVNVGVIAPANWSFSNPSEGIKPFFVELGDTISTGADFAITPPVGEGPGNGTSQDGYLLGAVFTDTNADGVQQANEVGQAGIDVFIDSNGSGSFELGERITSTNVNGAYIFEDVTPGTHVVRIETAGTQFVQIFPQSNGPQVVSLAGGGTVSNILFGLFGDSSNPATATFDFGDLPASYGVTLLAEDGARHPQGVYYLGPTDDIDAEFNGLPSLDARGDDDENISDENGIVVDALEEGTTGRLVATASLFGGYLQGWVDFNGDNDFDEVGERIITNELLSPGANEVFFEIPATITTGDVFARFRYGEFGIDSVTGAALIGEVEDYKLEKVAPPIPSQFANGPDFDNDGDVDGSDFLSWQAGFGTAAVAAVSDGDANGDNNVDQVDLTEWSAGFGESAPIAASVQETADFDGDGDADGSDFLAWQTGFGAASPVVALSDGDADSNNNVNSQDLSVWLTVFGVTTENAGSGSAPLAAIVGESETTSPVASASTSGAPLTASTSEAPLTASTSEAPLFASAPEAPVSTTVVASPRFVASTATAVEPNVARLESKIQREALLALAGTSRSTDEVGLARIRRRIAPTRFETESFDTTSRHSTDTADVELALRDRVLDRLFANRPRHAELADPGARVAEVRGHESGGEEALALALGEDIHWRFS